MSRGVTASETLYKQPSEKRKYGMQFSELLGTDGILSISSITSEQIGGCTTDLTISNSGVSGTQVNFWIEGGTHGQRYRIEVLINTSGTAILEGDGILVVRDR